ncbi:hypothetical protein NPIL_448061 [Nephila pilipes]|uniref:Uncharacterized protein n=1 Tax=Nephila pilipes TaxID=299642 RepID=A0A8X6THT2_NEPPI|nr:hypothetical protein NPIL_448061 [Nephila pilipes]
MKRYAHFKGKGVRKHTHLRPDTTYQFNDMPRLSCDRLLNPPGHIIWETFFNLIALYFYGCLIFVVQTFPLKARSQEVSPTKLVRTGQAVEFKSMKYLISRTTKAFLNKSTVG